MNKHKQAFTLVELIVVITILAILWTIAFISLQWYARDARDSVRVADLKSIEKWLEFLLLTDSKLPKPESSINIVASGTTIYYQWYAWETVLWKISVHGKAKDPLDDIHYTYMTDTNLRNYQLLWFSEWSDVLAYNKNILNQTNAADYSERYWIVRWKELWIITDANNTPVQEIETTEIVLDWTNSWTLYRAHINNWKTYSFSWYILTHKLYTLSKPSIYWPPRDCPDWFIPSWWDSAFNQLWFCVAAYEMSYDETWVADVTWFTDRNTRKYFESKTPVSMPNRLPITEINQPQAIAHCQKIWAHLITNNEWMSLARQIEFNPENWSSWIVWDWYIPNWVWNETANNHWCSWKQWDSEWNNTDKWAWITWSDCSWTNRNILKLYNWEYIYDLSWNVSEHVNLTNDINSIDWVIPNWNACWANARYSWFWNDWNALCNFQNWYTKALYWPILDINANNGIGRLLWGTASNRILIRSSDAEFGSFWGIFTLDTYTSSSQIYSFFSFRCTY